MQTVQRQTVIAALEMAYDYYSARTVLKRHLRAANLDSNLERFDADALAALIESLGQEGSRTAPVIGMLTRHAGNVVATATRAAPERREAAKQPEAPVEAKVEKVEAKPEPAAKGKTDDDDDDDRKKASRGKSKGKSKGKSGKRSSAVADEPKKSPGKKSRGKKK